MKEALKKDYEEAKIFWNAAFGDITANSNEKNAQSSLENDFESLAPSKKLKDAVVFLSQKKKILDYGCGGGWASVIAAKNGCKNVTGVDLSENAIKATVTLAERLGADNAVKALCVSDSWLRRVPAESYDGIICSNVLDVIPSEVAEEILCEFSRIARGDASVIIGMNYYKEPKSDSEKSTEVRYGNHIYLNGILRLVSRTDDEWREVLGRYFYIDRLEHFAWQGEEVERRRLFYLRKK